LPGFIQELPNARKTGYHEDLVQPGDHARGPKRHHGVGEHGDGELAALKMDVAVDQAGDKMVPRRVNDDRAFAHVFADISDRHDPLSGDRHIRRVDLLGEHVDQAPSRDDQIGGAGRRRSIEQTERPSPAPSRSTPRATMPVLGPRAVGPRRCVLSA